MTLAVLLILVVGLVAACQLGSNPTAAPTPTAVPATSAVASSPPPTAPASPPPTAVPAPAASPAPSPAPASPAPSPAAAASPPACTYGPTRKVAQLQDRAIGEASALVASQQWPGIYWTLNDSGNDPFIFAFDEQGQSRGTFRVEGADNVDWEAMQLGRGADGGFALYIGDVGDNDEGRRESVIYRIPEPQPEAGPVNGKPSVKSTARAEAFKITFPGGSRNTEAMLLHPATGQIFLVTKSESAVSRVFRVPMPLDSKRTVALESVGRIDLARLGTRTDGLVTDAAISADGHRVAIRTYTTVFEFDLADSESLDNLASRPARFYRLGDGPQGEGMTYRLDGKALMSTGESTPAYLFETPWQC